MWSNQNGTDKRSTDKFPCHYCDKTFTRQAGLVGHLRVHTGERPHQCQMCGRRFSDSSSLTKHIRTHTGEKPFLCNFCNRAFSISHNLSRHLKLHSKEHQNVGSKVKISNYEDNHNRNSKKTYVSSKGGVVCRSFPELNSHIQNIHSKCESKQNAISSVNSDSSPMSSLAKIKPAADLTEMLLHKEVYFQNEQKIIIELSDDDDDDEKKTLLMAKDKNQDYLKHPISDSIHIDQNRSEASDKNTDNKRQNFLLGEILKSTKTELLQTIPVDVSHCSNSSSFSDPSDRLLHDVSPTTHTNTFYNPNPNPNSSFFSHPSDQLLHDVSPTTHTNTFYNPNPNSSSFSRPSDQLLHDVSPTTHTNTFYMEENKETASRVLNQCKSFHIKKVSTDNNGKTKSHNKTVPSVPFQYRHEGILKKGKTNRHVKTLLRENLKKTTEKQKRKHILLSETRTPPNTSVQKQAHNLHSFSQQNLPEDIINDPLHTSQKKYPCLYCGKVFTRPGGLVGHTRMHTGEKPYKCQTCGKRFSDSSSLTKHIRTHTGEKPFHCKFCYRAFSISHNLTRHLKLHSRDKLHSRERKHFNQTYPGKTPLQIRNDSRLLERRINKFNSSANSKLRNSCSDATSFKISTTEPSLVSTVDPVDDLQLLRENTLQTVENYLTQFNENDPTLISDRHLSQEMVMLENDIKPILTNISSLQMKIENSNTDQECGLTSCPDSENNYFSNIKENLEQVISIPCLMNSKLDPKDFFQKSNETNEILKNDSSVNSLNNTNVTYNQSFSDVSKNVINNIEPQLKVEPSWYESVNNEGIESEINSFLSNNEKFDSTTIVSVDDGNYINSECLFKPESVQLPLLESNKQQTALGERSQPSHVYRCGYCLQQFKTIHLLSQHIQVHNKMSELRIERKATENKISLSETESFREIDILKKEINSTFEDKSYRLSEETELNSNFQSENMETQVSETTKPQSNFSLSSMKASTDTKQNHNFHSLKSSQTKIPMRKTLLNGAKSKFHCTYCNKMFNRHGGLIGHLRVHTGEKPYVCHICSKRFSDSSSLTKHIRTHTGEKPFTCTICYRAFSISHNLTRHLKLHAKEKQQRFNKSKSRNLFKSTEKVKSLVRCSYCSATFQSLKILKCHLRNHSVTSETLKAGKRNAVRNDQRIIHNANDPLMEKTKMLIDENNEIQVNNFGEDIISENLCNKKKDFSSISRIQNKTLKNRNYHFDVTNSRSLGRKYMSRGINFKTFPQTTLWSNLPSTEINLKSSKEINNKNNEMIPVSLNVTKESADVATLSWDNALMPQRELLTKFTEPRAAGISKDNIDRKSVEIKPINEESETGIIFKSSQMNNNNADLKTGGESRISSQCLKPMLMEKTSVNHETCVNENVPIYSTYSWNDGKEIENTQNDSTSGSKCGYCHKSFRDFSSLSRHMSMHKEQQQLKRYCSNRVGLSYSWASSSNKRLKMLRFGSERKKLWKNLNNGRMYVCPFCPKQFTRHGGLVGHLRVHTGEKPHQCQTCMKRFSDSSSLTKHIRTHTGEKPFHCKLCHRAFSISHNLTRHLKLHSRDGPKVSSHGQKVKTKKNEKCSQPVNANQQLAECNTPSVKARPSADASHQSSSDHLQGDYCKIPDPFNKQFCYNKNTISNHEIHKISNPVSSSSSNINLVSRSNDQEYSHLQKISSHMRHSFEPALRMTTNHLLNNVRDLSLSLSNDNLSSAHLLNDPEITLEYKSEFLSHSNKESNFPNKNLLVSGVSSSVSPISQQVTINHLPSTSQKTLGLSSHAEVSTAYLVPSNTNDVVSLNKSPQISSTRNESENQTNPFSDTFSQTVLLLKSLTDYNSDEMKNLQPKHYSRNLTTENQQANQIPNSCIKYPNTNSNQILTSSFPAEKTISESFFKPIKPLRSSCIKEDNCISIETVSSNVTEPLLIKTDSAIKEKPVNPFHTFHNSQASSKNAKGQAPQINSTFTNKPSQSLPSQKAPIHKNTCILCRTYFPNLQQLEVHLKIHRTQDKTFTCGYCSRNFACFSGVMSHARVHTLERPYRCNICQRAFSDSSSLTKHTRIHTGEKPFTCKYCSRTFSISHNLTRHLKIHLREKNNPL